MISTTTPTSDRRFTRNILWNLLGTGLPMVVALVAVPRLVHGLGTARFGILSLAWIVVGYFSLFDLGLGRAMTQLVAEKLGKGQTDQVPAVVWASMTLMAALGVAGAGVISVLSPWLVGSVLEIPVELKAETLPAFYLLALSIPVVISTTGLRGILEAHQRFDLANIVRVPLGAITYLGPLLMLSYSNTLPSMVLVLVAARFLSLVVYLVMCLTLYPDLRRRAPLAPELMRRLLSFGGWMTVSNIAGPLLLYLGRLQIAVLVSASAVAYFSAPYDVVINLLVIPGVVVTVLFPALTLMLQRDVREAGALYRRSMLQLGLVMLPLAVATIILAKPGLARWINEEFSSNGYRVAQLLAGGVFINSFGHVSQALIQAYGRPDLTAKLHIAELVLYVPYSWWLIESQGITGAAVAWVIRVTISTVVLAIIAQRCLAGSLVRSRWAT
ncbi:MAG: flippase [Gemmatimonadetes bacterium]|nr:flippase [Gemmatimonadota bacterium]